MERSKFVVEEPNKEPSLWAQYVTEVRGGTTTYIEYPWGFTCYSFPDFAPDCIYMEELFISEPYRLQGKAAQITHQVIAAGRKAGKKYVLGIVLMSSKTAHYTLKGYLDWGFTAVSAIDNGQGGAVWLKRPIPQE